MRNRLLLIAAITLHACLSVACGGRGDAGREPDVPGTVELRVMSFNIEWGGTHISFANVVEAIRRADADIVGIQEAEGNLERLAADLGWHYDLRNYVVSRFPLIDPPGADGRYVLVEVEPGRVVAIGNVHLPSSPYGPYAVRDGASTDDVLAIEQAARMPAIAPTLSHLPPLAGRGIPVFVTGDFNAPSHADWTAATAASRSVVRYALNWPVSRAMSDAGFHDSWRTVHPDPVADPGLTWWAARPPLARYMLSDDEPRDRIDFVWYAGPAIARSSELVGEDGAPGVAISVMPWPSDHRGVVSLFDAKPAAISDMITTGHRVYREGDDVDVRHFLTGEMSAGIAVIARDAGRSELARRDAAGTGTIVFPAGTFDPGHYEARLTKSGTPESITREFWILERDASPAVSVGEGRFSSGEPIDLHWENAPGYRNDYIAIYAAGTAPSDEGTPVWVYVDALPSGRLQIDASTAGPEWPLAPGRYVAWLLKDDGHEMLARSDEFVID